MNRIDCVFSMLKKEGKCGFIPYVTAGYPDFETTEQIVRELSRRGAAVVELGVPFSDPVADGPVIQESAQEALRAGATLKKVIALVDRLRRDCTVPIVLFSYFNPIYRMGVKDFAYAARDAGADGVLILDVPFEEARAHLNDGVFKGLKQIFLVSPTTTPDRLSLICREAEGFVYAISRLGVTGTDKAVSDRSRALVEEIKKRTGVPVAVGFGVSTSAHVREVASYADAVVVGSAFVAAIKKALPGGREAAVQAVGTLASHLMEGLS